jgi:3-hydroxyacyl-[acyl-carrier-protein] dehydratase
MEGLYRIDTLSYQDAKATGEIHLDTKHDIFKGHFPQQPILPGVCQMEIVSDIVSKVLQSKIVFFKSKSLKYTQMVDPSNTPVLSFEIEIKVVESEVVAIGKLFKEEAVFFKFNIEYIITK